jgi:hypothetical protein
VYLTCRDELRIDEKAVHATTDFTVACFMFSQQSQMWRHSNLKPTTTTFKAVQKPNATATAPGRRFRTSQSPWHDDKKTCLQKAPDRYNTARMCKIVSVQERVSPLS